MSQRRKAERSQPSGKNGRDESRKGQTKGLASRELISALQNRFHLSGPEALVYSSLLVMGQLTPGEISIYSGMELEQVALALEVLEDKQLVKAMPGVVRRYRAFAPYRELAVAVETFRKRTAKLRRGLRKVQRRASERIRVRLEEIAQQIESGLSSWVDTQDSALAETIDVAKAVLDSASADLQKSLASLSEDSCSKLSRRTDVMRQNLQQIVDEGINQLQEELARSIGSLSKTLSAHLEASEQLLSAISNKLFQHLTEAVNRLKEGAQKSVTALKEAAESGIENASAPIAECAEITGHQVEESSSAMTREIEALGEELVRAIEEWQERQSQVIAGTVDAVARQLSESAEHGLQALDQTVARLEETLQLELQRVTREARKTLTRTRSALREDGEEAARIGEGFVEGLREVLAESAQAYDRLQRDTAEALSRWPPESLDTDQLGEIKENLSGLTETAASECDELLGSIDRTIGEEVGGTYLAQLKEARSLLEDLGKELASQRSIIESDVSTMVAKLEEEITARLSSIRTAADAFIQELQTNIHQLEEKGRELGRQSQELLYNQMTSLLGTLGTAEERLHLLSEERLEQAKQVAEELCTTCSTRISEYREALKNRIEAFKDAMTRRIDEYSINLQQALSQVHETVMRITGETGKTAESLRQNLAKQVEESLAEYRLVLEKRQEEIDRELSKAFQKALSLFRSAQRELLAAVDKDAQSGRKALEEIMGRATTALEEALRQAELDGKARAEEQKAALSKIIEEYNALLLRNAETSQEAIRAALERASQVVAETITNFQNTASKILSSTIEGLEQETAALRGTLDEEVETTLHTFAQEMVRAKSALDAAAEEASRRAHEVIQASQESIASDLQRQVDEITSVVKHFAAAAKESLQSQAQQASGRIKKSIDTKRHALRAASQTSIKAIVQALREAESTSNTTLKAVTGKVEPMLQAVQNTATDTHRILTELWEALSRVPPSETERTWHLVGRKSIKNHLVDMLRRTQSTITLVYPTLDEAPLGDLKGTSNEVRIHLITTIDPTKHRQIIQELLQRGNIRIWRSPRMEFYAGARDGEEVLIAPIHGETKEPVALVSDHESYVALFNQVLGPRWVSRAKEVRRRRTAQQSK